MWWRILLAGGALLCTFTETSAHGEGTPRIVQIKDIMCVLLLGGLKKDDLDKSTWEKLQRYKLNGTNVSINCDNNELENNQTEESEETTPKDLSTTTIKTELENANMKFMEDIVTKSLKIAIHVIENGEKNREVKRSTVENQVQCTTTLPDTITDDQKTPNLESVLKFWQKLNNGKLTTAKPTTSAIVDGESFLLKMLEENIENQLNNKMDYINKIIATLQPTTRKPIKTKTPEIDVNILSDYLKRTLKNEDLVQKVNDNASEREKLDTILRIFMNKKGVSKPTTTTSTTTSTTTTEKVLIEQQLLKDILNLLKNNVTTTPSTTTVKVTTKSIDQNSQVLSLLTSIHNSLIKPNKTANVEENRSNNGRILPPAMIRRIVENVKTMVMKDLRKEINTMSTAAPITTKTTTKTTTTRTTTLTTSTKTQTTTQRTPSTTTTTTTTRPAQEPVLLDKMLELVEQLKSTHEKSIILPDGHYEVTANREVKQGYQGPIKMYVPPVGPPTDTFPEKYPQSPKSDAIPHDIQLLSDKIDPYFPLHTYQSNTMRPVMMQTNLDRIPPLGVPLQAKGQNVENQMIVYTTSRANIKSRVDRQYWDRVLHKNAKPHAYENKGIYENYNARDKYGHPVRPLYEGARRPRGRDYQNYHQKLEMADGGRGSALRGADDDIMKIYLSSRQQLPLEHMRRPPRYDDRNFNNFLNTQKKVNAMLERILATKVMKGKPRSVETI